MPLRNSRIDSSVVAKFDQKNAKEFARVNENHSYLVVPFLNGCTDGSWDSLIASSMEDRLDGSQGRPSALLVSRANRHLVGNNGQKWRGSVTLV